MNVLLCYFSALGQRIPFSGCETLAEGWSVHWVAVGAQCESDSFKVKHVSDFVGQGS